MLIFFLICFAISNVHSSPPYCLRPEIQQFADEVLFENCLQTDSVSYRCSITLREGFVFLKSGESTISFFCINGVMSVKKLNIKRLCNQFLYEIKSVPNSRNICESEKILSQLHI